MDTPKINSLYFSDRLTGGTSPGITLRTYDSTVVYEIWPNDLAIIGTNLLRLV